MLKTGLFLILLLTGALASEKLKAKNDPDCVDPVDGEKYYIRLKAPNLLYSYVFANRMEADAQNVAQLQAITHDILQTKDELRIQEFTFQDGSLFAEMKPDKKPESKNVKYYVGLNFDDKVDDNLYVSKDMSMLRSHRVVLKDKNLSIDCVMMDKHPMTLDVA